MEFKVIKCIMSDIFDNIVFTLTVFKCILLQWMKLINFNTIDKTICCDN